MTTAGPTAPGAFAKRGRRPGAARRVICFPFAGGTSLAYRTWPEQLGSDVDVCAYELPGHGGRFSERALTRMEALMPDVLDAVMPLADRPLVLFGHSMGASIAFETALALAAVGRSPRALVLSARGTERDRVEPVHHLPAPKLIEKLKEFNGAPAEALENAELMELMLPMIRADFELSETYKTSPTVVPSPIIALGGTRDALTWPDDLSTWSTRTSGRFERHVYDGDHFYLRSHEASVLGHLTRAFEMPL